MMCLILMELRTVKFQVGNMKGFYSMGLGINKFKRMTNGNGRSSYNIALWNCRKGLLDAENRASEKMTEVMKFMDEQKLHILCLVESEFHGQQSRVRRRQPLTESQIKTSLAVVGYKIILPQTWYVHGQARIVMYVKEDVNVTVTPLAREYSDLPTLTCVIGMGKERKTIVNFFYREWSSGVSGLVGAEAQRERLRRQVQLWRNFQNNSHDVIIMGDANLCALKWEEEGYQHRELADFILDYLGDINGSQIVTGNTHMSAGGGVGDSSSCLDHCYTNVPEKIVSTKVVPVGNSDHLGIVVKKLTKFQATRPQVIRKRCYKYFDAEAFLIDILTSNINNEVVKEKSIDSAAKKFEMIFKKVLDTHAPERNIQIRSNYQPFITEETKQLIMERRNLQREAVKSGSRELRKEFNKKNKEVKKRMKEDKKKYFEEKFRDCNSKNVWRTANEMLGTVKNLSPTNILSQEDTDSGPAMVNNPERIANIFNEFFIRKVKNLRQKSRVEPVVPPVERLRNWLSKRATPPPPFTLKKIGFQALRRAIKRMKGKRSCGVDTIDSYSLKLAAPLIEEALLHLINLSIEKCTFARNWKPQLLMPTFKKKDRLMVENYRPVSNLVETGKLAEYVIAEQIMSHFLQNDLFHSNHHGSLPAHSTATALIQLTDLWMNAAEKKQLTGVCMLDQSAAYDLLDHEIFANKLREYNFSDESISWIKSYLGGRTQCVRVESKQSAFINCEECGSPQGSIMSCIFHVINSNDLPDCHDDAESIVYVDDDTDSVHDGDPAILAVKLQYEVQNSVHWLKDNRMCVAGDKSKLLIVGTRELRATRLRNEITLEVDGNEITESKTEKLLGVTVNSMMTWKEHLYGDAESQGLISQLKQRVGTLKRLSKYTSKDCLKMLVNGLFYSVNSNIVFQFLEMYLD